MPVSLVFGKPITPAVVYTGTMKVTRGDDYKEIESATITVRPNGDNKYTFSVPDIGGEDAITFVADGETDETALQHTALRRQNTLCSRADGKTTSLT